MFIDWLTLTFLTGHNPLNFYQNNVKKIARLSMSPLKVMEIIPGAQGSGKNSVRQQVKHMVMTADIQ